MSANASGVVTSVKPIGLIASALTENVTETSVLVPDGASPHHYALKPSDMKKLADADLIIWVGPQLEHFLDRPIERVDAPKLELASVVDMKLSGDELTTADPDAVDPEHAEHEQHEHADHHEEVEGMDEHPWLDPVKAAAMAKAIATTLEQRYPDKLDVIRGNLARFETRLSAADSKINKELMPYRSRGFYVFHDAYQSLGEHYQLNLLGYIVVTPGRQPGARHLTAIRQALQDHQAVCVFSEPQVTPAIVNMLTEGTDVRVEPLDPLAMNFKLEPDAYPKFLESLGNSLVRCLKP